MRHKPPAAPSSLTAREGRRCSLRSGLVSKVGRVAGLWPAELWCGRVGVVHPEQVDFVKEEQPSLGQLIWLVRRELEWVHQADRDHPLRFDVGTVEVDVIVEVTRATTGGGGLDLKVLSVGASGNLSGESRRGTTSNVHVTLTPVDTRTGSRRYEISARDTEPPSRQADAVGEKAAESVRSSEPGTTGGGRGWVATDTEPSPGS
jgi:hypothetical protein